MTNFRAASAESDHWGLAAKSCLERLAPLPIGANLGFVYVTDGFVDDLSSIIVFLRETTSIAISGGNGAGILSRSIRLIELMGQGTPHILTTAP